jgi:hypothetical protein
MHQQQEEKTIVDETHKKYKTNCKAIYYVSNERSCLKHEWK